MCRELVVAAAERDDYAGVSFIDPFDGVTVRWHPAGRARVELGNDALPLFISAPLGKPRGGEYPVNYFGVELPVGSGWKTRAAKLRRSGAATPRGWRRDTEGSLYTGLAPCLIHTLDAAFAGCVVEQLVAHELRDFAIVHDCFLVPSGAESILLQAIVDAGRPWFLSLGPIYSLFENYLSGRPGFEERARGWRQAWERRVAAGNDWPTFRVKEETTQAWKVERV